MKTVKWIVILISGLLIVSCVPGKEMAYFKKYNSISNIDSPDDVYYIVKDSIIYIKSGDQLYITVSSGDDKPNSFNQNARSGSSAGTELIGYPVDDEGYIRLPYLKRVKAAGYTIKELTNMLETELSQYIFSPAVSIRIINKRITILGEVNSPGMYLVNQNSLNIYQALAQAGDIAPYGNRKNVLIVRREGDNVMKKHIDLTNDAILASSWYEIQPDDIIYVEPLGRKKMGMETFSVFSLISLITSTYAVYVIITNL